MHSKGDIIKRERKKERGRHRKRDVVIATGKCIAQTTKGCYSDFFVDLLRD